MPLDQSKWTECWEWDGDRGPCASGGCSPTSQLLDLAKHWPLEVFLQLQAALKATVQELPSISSTPPAISAAGLAGRVWERWKRSCLADAGQCHPTTRSPPGCTETAPLWNLSPELLALSFPSLFQPDSSLHIPPKSRHYQPGCCSDIRDTAARVRVQAQTLQCVQSPETRGPPDAAFAFIQL